MADNGNEIEKFKRQFGDLIADLHARNLAIPAGILVVLIIFAVFILPKSPAPPAPVSATPIVKDDGKKVTLAKVANLTVVSATPLDDENTPDYGQANPFKVGTATTCTVTKMDKPREFECIIGSTKVQYACLPSDNYDLCVQDPNGASSGTGSTGTSGGTGSPSYPPTDDNGGSDKKTTVTYYTIDVKYDGKTYKGLEAGDQLPTKGGAIVFYAGPNSKATEALFVLGDNVSVQGAEADPDLGTFQIGKGDEVVLTESNYQVHNLELKKITKVTKSE